MRRPYSLRDAPDLHTIRSAWQAHSPWLAVKSLRAARPNCLPKQCTRLRPRRPLWLFRTVQDCCCSFRATDCLYPWRKQMAQFESNCPTAE